MWDGIRFSFRWSPSSPEPVSARRAGRSHGNEFSVPVLLAASQQDSMSGILRQNFQKQRVLFIAKDGQGLTQVEAFNPIKMTNPGEKLIDPLRWNPEFKAWQKANNDRAEA